MQSEEGGNNRQKEIEKLREMAEAIKDDRKKHLVIVAKKAIEGDNVYDLKTIEKIMGE